MDEISLLYRAESPNHFVDSAKDLEMIWVEPGTFTMGSPTTEVGHAGNEDLHEVTLTKGFYLGKYEVTQAQYEAVMSGNNKGLSPTPSHFSNNPNHPVEKVSWSDVQEFLKQLNEEQANSLPMGVGHMSYLQKHSGSMLVGLVQQHLIIGEKMPQPRKLITVIQMLIKL